MAMSLMAMSFLVQWPHGTTKNAQQNTLYLSKRNSLWHNLSIGNHGAVWDEMSSRPLCLSIDSVDVYSPLHYMAQKPCKWITRIFYKSIFVYSGGNMDAQVGAKLVSIMTGLDAVWHAMMVA